MKELTIEEKAKRYDEVVDRLRYAFNSNRCTLGFMNEILHYPRESEDERVKKEIISFIQDDIDEINLKVSGDYDDRDEDDIAHQNWCKKAIAWLENIPYTIDHEKREGFHLGYKAGLEKQGEHKKFRDSIQVGDEVTRNSDGVIINLSQLKRVAKKSEQKLPIEKLPEEMKTIGESLGFTTQEECDEYNHIVSDLIMSGDNMEEQKSNVENKKLTDVNHEYFSELLENDNSEDINDYAYQVAYCMSHDWIEETATWEDVQKAVKLGAQWQKQQLIDKACEWLNNFYSEDRHCYFVKEDIDNFKKAMEE